MFRVLFLDIYHWIMRNPPNLKMEIYKKILIRKLISKNFSPRTTQKLEFLSTLYELFLKNFPASGGSAPEPCIFIYLFFFFCVYAFNDMLASGWKICSFFHRIFLFFPRHLILSFGYLWASPPPPHPKPRDLLVYIFLRSLLLRSGTFGPPPPPPTPNPAHP